jgi:hypothetical protein
VARTSNSQIQTKSTLFSQIPGAALNMVVPAGTDCLIVTFSAETRAATTYCGFQATANGVEMNPLRSPSGRLGAFDTSATGMTLVWMQTVNVQAQTTFLVKIDWRLVPHGNTNQNSYCELQDWSFVVERRN